MSDRNGNRATRLAVVGLAISAAVIAITGAAEATTTLPATLHQAELSPAGGSNDTFDTFGQSVAVSGNTVVVGVPGETVGTTSGAGAVLIFNRPSDGRWVDSTAPAAELTVPDDGNGGGLGSSVAISGGTIVAGASNYQSGSNAQQGAAYVFTEPTSGWTSTSTPDAQLTVSTGAAGDELGSSVGVSGDTVVVGAPKQEVGANSQQGEAYVFTKPASGGWVDTATPTAALTSGADGAASDTFGASVAIDGDTIAIGAPQHTVATNTWQGSAYIFAEPGTGGWADSTTPTADLTIADGGSFDELGMSVALDSETLVVGAPGAGGFEGAAQVFVEPTTGGWVTSATPVAQLTADDAATSDQLGTSVAISGNVIVAGAPQHTIGSGQQQGEAYAFVEPASNGWATTATPDNHLVSSDGGTSDSLGTSVAVDGSTVVAGAPEHPSAGGEGAVYVFTPPVPDNSAVAASHAAVIPYARHTTLSTTVTDTTAPGPVVGGHLTLQKKAAGTSTWRTAAHAVTDAAGDASATVTATTTTKYRWQLTGTAAHYAATSPASTVSVAQKLRIASEVSGSSAKRVLTAYGTVTPAAAGHKVQLELRRNGRWVVIAHTKLARISLPGGHHELGYSFTVSKHAKGHYVYRVLSLATATNAAGASGAVALTVR